MDMGKGLAVFFFGEFPTNLRCKTPSWHMTGDDSACGTQHVTLTRRGESALLSEGPRNNNLQRQCAKMWRKWWRFVCELTYLATVPVWPAARFWIPRWMVAASLDASNSFLGHLTIILLKEKRGNEIRLDGARWPSALYQNGMVAWRKF